MNLVVMVALAASSVGADATELSWSQHYANAKTAAKQANRPLLVVIEDSSTPRAQFDEQQLASKTDQIQLLKNFELCRIDVRTDYGRRVAQAYGARGFPYTAITDRTATLITFRRTGQMSPSEWENTLLARVATPIEVRINQPSLFDDQGHDSATSVQFNRGATAVESFYRPPQLNLPIQPYSTLGLPISNQGASTFPSASLPSTPGQPGTCFT